MNRPTVHDIAKEAGVSLATVDRVLNARPGVRDKTIAKVQGAVARLGYVRDTYAANLARKRLYRFVFVLPEGPNQFADSLRAALDEAHVAQVSDRTVIEVVRVPLHDPHAIVRRLRQLAAETLDGVALMVPETPQVRDAVALVSDLPNSRRDHFIGTNNVAAGRTAGLLMGRFVQRSGEVLVVTNSMRARDSLERRLGFDAVLAAGFPGLRVLPSVESFDDPARMRAVVRAVLAQRRAVVGIYSMGSGNTALSDALRESGHIGDLVSLAHELTPTTETALRAGALAAVIAQNVGHLARSALRVLRALCDGSAIYEAQERVRIEIILRENIG